MAKHLVAGMAGYSHPAAMASVQRVNEEWLAPIVPIRLAPSPSLTRRGCTARYPWSMPLPLPSMATMPMSPWTRRPLSACGADKLGCELHARVASQVHGVATTGFPFF
jgi:UDP-glucose 4-epimerase